METQYGSCCLLRVGRALPCLLQAWGWAFLGLVAGLVVCRGPGCLSWAAPRAWRLVAGLAARREPGVLGLVAGLAARREPGVLGLVAGLAARREPGVLGLVAGLVDCLVLCIDMRAGLVATKVNCIVLCICFKISHITSDVSLSPPNVHS